MAKPQHKMSVSSNADQDDLFSAHDFDIHIDLPTNSNGKFLSVTITCLVNHHPFPSGASNMSTPKLARTTKEETSRRSLNLSDYKKRKGLI